MLDVLSAPLNFKFIDHTTSKSNKKGQMSGKIVPADEFEVLVRKWGRLSRPKLYVRHMLLRPFMLEQLDNSGLNFTFINVIRDPVEHAISQWYYNQTGSEFGLVMTKSRDHRVENATNLIRYPNTLNSS